MADLAKIFTGMDKGPETINDNFNKINDDNGTLNSKIDGINWSGTTTEGIVYNGNFEYVAGGYSTANIGGIRLVHLNIAIRLTRDFTNNGVGDAFTLPQSLNMGQNCGVASEHATWVSHDGLKINLQPAANEVENWKQGDAFNVNVIY